MSHSHEKKQEAGLEDPGSSAQRHGTLNEYESGSVLAWLNGETDAHSCSCFFVCSPSSSSGEKKGHEGAYGEASSSERREPNGYQDGC